MRNGWDGAIAELAQRQHGVVARTQLVDLGFGRGAIDHWLDRHPGRPGAPALRAILATGAIGAGITRSELEERFLALLDDAGLPAPEVNVALAHASGWVEADCVWRALGVVAELDGYASHGTRAAFERDRARDRALQAAGWHVARITWRHLEEEPDVVVAELRELLGRRVRPFRSRRGERAISVRPGARPRP